MNPGDLEILAFGDDTDESARRRTNRVRPADGQPSEGTREDSQEKEDLMSEERGEYIVDGSGAEGEWLEHGTVMRMITKLIDDPGTPSWTQPVLRSTAEADHTYPLVHLREDVRLLVRIMEGDNPDEIELWLAEDVIPGWMRLALALFQEADSRFARAQFISEAEVLEEVITIKCGFD